MVIREEWLFGQDLLNHSDEPPRECDKVPGELRERPDILRLTEESAVKERSLDLRINPLIDVYNCDIDGLDQVRLCLLVDQERPDLDQLPFLPHGVLDFVQLIQPN